MADRVRPPFPEMTRTRRERSRSRRRRTFAAVDARSRPDGGGQPGHQLVLRPRRRSDFFPSVGTTLLLLRRIPRFRPTTPFGYDGSATKVKNAEPEFHNGVFCTEQGPFI